MNTVEDELDVESTALSARAIGIYGGLGEENQSVKSLLLQLSHLKTF